jgi:hypothetical protein
MAKELKGYVTLGDRTYGPGESLPDDVDASALSPELFKDGDEHDDEVVAGPGQVGPPESDEDRKAREDKEAKLKADRDRKAKKRADDKAAADAAALKAAEDAEAKRAAEEAAAQGGGQ